jgi:hypothetical protein
MAQRQMDFLPATAAIFYINLENPKGGGTGRTVRACVATKYSIFFTSRMDYKRKIIFVDLDLH